MRDGSPRSARESGQLRLDVDVVPVLRRDGYSNDLVAGRENRNGKDLHDGKGVSQDVNCVDLVWNVPQRHCERQRNGQVHR